MKSCSRNLRRWFGCLGWLCVLAFPGALPAAQTPRFVFAHYMVCFATYGENLEGFKREIREAQAAGIDGFALNVGAWNDTETYYKRRVALMYDAAEQLDTGFKLFFSPDFGEETNIVDMVSRYANRPASFRHNGKLVLSAWGHNNVPLHDWTGLDWTNGVLRKLATNGIPAFFIPFFFSNPVREIPNYSNGAELFARYGSLLDGLFMWAAAGLPYELAQANNGYIKAAREAGKTIMGGISPTYWGHKQPGLGRRYYEFDGGEGIALQWSNIISNQPDWVEIATWNDFHESTYLSPVDNPGDFNPELQSPQRHSHKGYLELSKRYIAWFKTGQEPPLDRDALFYFYRSHPKDLAAANTNDLWVGWRTGDVQDTLYTTLWLTAPAELEIESGNRLTTNALAAGKHQLRTPFAPGPQKFTLRRDGQTVLNTQGPNVQASIEAYNFFTTSGYAYGTNARVRPPADLKTVK